MRRIEVAVKQGDWQKNEKYYEIMTILMGLLASAPQYIGGEYIDCEIVMPRNNQRDFEQSRAYDTACEYINTYRQPTKSDLLYINSIIEDLLIVTQGAKNKNEIKRKRFLLLTRIQLSKWIMGGDEGEEDDVTEVLDNYNDLIRYLNDKT